MTSRQLKIARSRLGWSQKRLAKELGVTIYTISRYENYLSPGSYAKKIPRVFDLALRYLLFVARDRPE